MKKIIALIFLIFAMHLHALTFAPFDRAADCANLGVQIQTRTFLVSDPDIDCAILGDTLVANIDSGNITVQIETNTQLLMRASSAIIFDGNNDTLNITLIDGQIFIDRKEKEFDMLQVFAQGYAFVPVGTAFAVKATPQGAPTVAVARGVVHMFAIGEPAHPTIRDTVIVEVGRFGTVNSNGIAVSGDLNERGISQLENWSGVRIRSDEDEDESEETTITTYIEVDDDEDDTRPLTKRELKRQRKEEKRAAKEARRQAKRERREQERERSTR